MPRHRARSIVLAATLAATLAPALASAAGPAAPAPATLAVIGDTPYGAQQIANFPNDVDRINADPAVSRVLHLGDIKNGSTVCSDGYYAFIRAQFDRFTDPLVYTPGDNEWTDCHRANNGSYNPLERLAKLRAVFFGQPGTTLGQEVAIEAQGGPVAENVTWSQGGAQFGLLHIVGSNNSRLPWTGLTAVTPEQLAEVDERDAANLKWLNHIFARAQSSGAAGVAVGIQADTFDLGTPGTPAYDDARASFAAFIKRLAQRAHDFHKPVLFIAGDSHQFTVDHPFTPGDAGYGVYDTTVDAPNVTRVIVQGSTSCPHVYLRLKVDPSTEAVFSGENVRLPLGAVSCDTAPIPAGF